MAPATHPVPRRVLPVLVLSQFAGVSPWFAVNAVMPDLQRELGWSSTAVGALTSSLQFGFILGTLVFALLALSFWFSDGWLTLCAGLALFLFGMQCLEEGLRQLAGSKLEQILGRSTATPFKSLLFGVAPTDPGQWAPFLAYYGGIWAIQNFLRPLRISVGTPYAHYRLLPLLPLQAQAMRSSARMSGIWSIRLPNQPMRSVWRTSSLGT